MEALVILAILYAWFSVIRKAVQGQRARNQGNARRVSPAGVGPARVRQAQKPEQARKTVQQPAPRSAGSGEGMSRGYVPMQTHMAELVQEEEALRRHQAERAYTGSLGGSSQEGASSQEGEDTCDPSLSHAAPSAYGANGVYADAIGAEPMPAWDGRSLLRGVIMSEILTRPAQRKWGRS